MALDDALELRVVPRRREARVDELAVLRAIDGVERVQSFPYFGIHTHRFAWDVG